ncbi:MAG: phage holin family protein [Clostridia bacterium]|nr:phage holin family protein [Clostridia bacterium]
MRRKRGGAFITLLICILSVPTVAVLMGELPKAQSWESYLPHLVTGAVLGLAHIILRPILRLITLPLGCLTLGLSGTIIDIALIYLSAGFVQGFAVPSFLYALLTAAVVNVVCGVVGR